MSINANHSYLRFGFKIHHVFLNNAMQANFSSSTQPTQLPLTLEKLDNGESASVMAINVESELKKRFFALGLKEGSHVRVLRRAKFGGPMHLRVGTSELILRVKEASCICLATPLIAAQ
jgi:ferrous iron transport protein A